MPHFETYQPRKESSDAAQANFFKGTQDNAEAQAFWGEILRDVVKRSGDMRFRREEQERELGFRDQQLDRTLVERNLEARMEHERGLAYADIQRKEHEDLQAFREDEQTYRENQRSKEYDRLWNAKQTENEQRARFTKYIDEQVKSGNMDEKEAGLARMLSDSPDEREKYATARIKRQQEEAAQEAERKHTDDTIKELEQGAKNLSGDDKLEYLTNIETLKKSGLTGKEFRQAIAPLLFKSLMAKNKTEAAKPISVGGVKYEDRTGLANGGVLRNMDEQQEAALELLAREMAAKDPRSKLKDKDKNLVYADQTPLIEEAKATILKLFGWTETDPRDPFDTPQMNPAKFSDRQDTGAEPEAVLPPQYREMLKGRDPKDPLTRLWNTITGGGANEKNTAALKAMQLLRDDKPDEAEKVIKAAGFKDFDEVEAFLRGNR